VRRAQASRREFDLFPTIRFPSFLFAPVRSSFHWARFNGMHSHAIIAILVWCLKLCLMSTSYSALIILKLTRVPLPAFPEILERRGPSSSWRTDKFKPPGMGLFATQWRILLYFFFGASSGVYYRALVLQVRTIPLQQE